MPYVDELERIRMAKEKVPFPKTVGDMNYLTTLDILEMFLKEPRYHTIHKIGRFFLFENSYRPDWYFKNVEVRLKFDLIDFQTAKFFAIQEFYSRVGRKYEDLAIKKNGDLDAYKVVLELIEEKEKQLTIQE